MALNTNRCQAASLPWRVALAATLATTLTLAATSATTTRHAEVGGIVLALAIIVLGVVVDSIAGLGSFEFWALLDMGKDILTAIVGGDEAKALLLEELLDCPRRRHCHKTISRFWYSMGGLSPQ